MNKSKYNFSKFSKPPQIKKSYGIACFRYNKKRCKTELLLVKKRYTYYFVEFLLGHYSKNDKSRVRYLLSFMTTDEKLDILSMNFGQMWYRVWMINPELNGMIDKTKILNENEFTQSNKFVEKYKKCKQHFKKSFTEKQLKDLVNNSRNLNRIWEIPKGRKDSPQEKDLNCAIREFYEETQITSNMFKLLEDKPKSIIYTNMKVKYMNYYYLGVILPSTLPKNYSYQESKLIQAFKREDSALKLNFKSEQVSEVVDIRWMSLEEVKIMDKSTRIAQFMENMIKYLKKRYKIHKL